MIKLKTIYISLFLVVILSNLGFSTLLLKNTIEENYMRERDQKARALVQGYYNTLTRGEFREFIEVSNRSLSMIGLEEVTLFNKVDSNVLSSNTISKSSKCVNAEYEICIEVSNFLSAYFKFARPSFLTLFSTPFIVKVLIQYTILILALMILFFWVLKFYSLRLIEFIKGTLLDEDTSSFNDEYKQLREPVIVIKDKIKILEKENTEHEKRAAVTEVARSVAHDIKSPLGTLRTLLSSKNEIDKELLHSVADRINGISQELLDKTRTEEASRISVFDRLSLLVKEKSLEHNREIKLKGLNELYINCYPSDFDRVISNLINNSIEFSQGEILLNVTDSAIVVSDKGVGIPPEIVSELLVSPRSWNKKDGNGVGLKGAKDFVESIGGSLDIKSKIGHGTEVHLKFLSLKEIVHIDDDELLRISWRYRAESQNLKYHGFSSYNEFVSSELTVSAEASFYVDYDLEFDEINGVEVLRKLYEQGHMNLFLSTGHESSEFEGIEYIKGTLGKEAPF